MGDAQSAQREAKGDAAAEEEESGEVKDVQDVDNKVLQKNGQISDINKKAESSISELNGNCEDIEAAICPEINITEAVEDKETPLENEIDLKDVAKDIEDELVEQEDVIEMDAKQNDINESFRKFFSNIGLKLTVKRGSTDKGGVPIDMSEEEPSKPEDIKGEDAANKINKDDEEQTELITAEEAVENDSTVCQTLTDDTPDDFQEKEGEKTAETNEEIISHETSPLLNEDTTPQEEPHPASPTGLDETASPFKKFFTTGIFSGLRKKKKLEDEEVGEKELVEGEVNVTQAGNDELHDEDVTPVLDAKVENLITKSAEVQEEAKAPLIVVDEITNSQEIVQESPLKRLLSGSSFKKRSKKQKGRKSSDAKLSDSGEHVSDQHLSSVESAENKKDETSAQTSAEGVSGEDGAWFSFKKLVTPQRRKKSSVDHVEEPIQGSKDGEKSVEGEQISDQSTEEGKRRKDSSVSWEAVLCGSGRRRSRKTSDSEDDTPQLDGEENRQNDRSKEAGSRVSTEVQEVLASPPKETEGPPEGDEGSTWKSFKKLVTPKRKSKDEGERISEIDQEDSSFSIIRLLSGRKTRKSVDVSPEEVSKEIASVCDEDSETPAVVPLSEFDLTETQTMAEKDADNTHQMDINEIKEEVQSKDTVQVQANDIPDNEGALEKDASSAVATNEEHNELTESSEHQHLSDIPEEGVLTENTPASEEAAKDETIAEDLLEITSEAITAPEPADVTLADETEMVSALSQLSESSKTSGNTTPVPAEYSVLNTETLLQQVSETIAISPKAVPVFLEEPNPERVVCLASNQILESSVLEKPKILEIHRESDVASIKTGLNAEEIDAVNEVTATAQAESISHLNEAILTEISSEVPKELLDTAKPAADEVYEVNISELQKDIKDMQIVEERQHAVEDTGDVDEEASSESLPKEDAGTEDVLTDQTEQDSRKTHSKEEELAVPSADDLEEAYEKEEEHPATELDTETKEMAFEQAQNEALSSAAVDELEKQAGAEKVELTNVERNIQSHEERSAEDTEPSEILSQDLTEVTKTNKEPQIAGAETDISPPIQLEEDMLETLNKEVLISVFQTVEVPTLESQNTSALSPDEELLLLDISQAKTGESKQVESLTEVPDEQEDKEIKADAAETEESKQVESLTEVPDEQEDKETKADAAETVESKHEELVTEVPDEQEDKEIKADAAETEEYKHKEFVTEVPDEPQDKETKADAAETEESKHEEFVTEVPDEQEDKEKKADAAETEESKHVEFVTEVPDKPDVKEIKADAAEKEESKHEEFVTEVPDEQEDKETKADAAETEESKQVELVTEVPDEPEDKEIKADAAETEEFKHVELVTEVPDEQEEEETKADAAETVESKQVESLTEVPDEQEDKEIKADAAETEEYKHKEFVTEVPDEPQDKETKADAAETEESKHEEFVTEVPDEQEDKEKKADAAETEESKHVEFVTEVPDKPDVKEIKADAAETEESKHEEFVTEVPDEQEDKETKADAAETEESKQVELVTEVPDEPEDKEIKADAAETEEFKHVELVTEVPDEQEEETKADAAETEESKHVELVTEVPDEPEDKETKADAAQTENAELAEEFKSVKSDEDITQSLIKDTEMDNQEEKQEVTNKIKGINPQTDADQINQVKEEISSQAPIINLEEDAVKSLDKEALCPENILAGVTNYKELELAKSLPEAQEEQDNKELQTTITALESSEVAHVSEIKDAIDVAQDAILESEGSRVEILEKDITPYETVPKAETAEETPKTQTLDVQAEDTPETKQALEPEPSLAPPLDPADISCEACDTDVIYDTSVVEKVTDELIITDLKEPLCEELEGSLSDAQDITSDLDTSQQTTAPNEEESTTEKVELQTMLQDVPQPEDIDIAKEEPEGNVAQQLDQETDAEPCDAKVKDEENVLEDLQGLQAPTAVHISSVDESPGTAEVLEKTTSLEEILPDCIDTAEVSEESRNEVNLCEQQERVEGAKVDLLSDAEIKVAATVSNVISHEVMSNLKEVSTEKPSAVVCEALTAKMVSESEFIDTVETTAPLVLDEINQAAEPSSAVLKMNVPPVEIEVNHKVQVHLMDVEIRSAEKIVDTVIQVGVTEVKGTIDVCQENIQEVENISATAGIEEGGAYEGIQVTVQDVMQHITSNLPESASDLASENEEQDIELKEIIQKVCETDQKELVQTEEDTLIIDSTEMVNGQEEEALTVTENSGIPVEQLEESKLLSSSPQSSEVSIKDHKEDLEEAKAAEPEIITAVGDVRAEVLAVKDPNESPMEPLPTTHTQVATAGTAGLAVPQNTGVISSAGNLESPSSLSLEFKLNIQFAQAKTQTWPSAAPTERPEPVRQVDVFDAGVQAEESVPKGDECKKQTELNEVAVQAVSVTEADPETHLNQRALIASQPVLQDVGIQAVERTEWYEQIQSTERATTKVQAVDVVQSSRQEKRAVLLSKPLLSELKKGWAFRQSEDENDVWLDAEEDIYPQHVPQTTIDQVDEHIQLQSESEQKEEAEPEMEFEMASSLETEDTESQQSKQKKETGEIESEGEDFDVALEELGSSVPAVE
ncbi:A-kinase anchor protein 12 [Cyprinodon tularosa]|uniref:A-kinase anchor protein 12 n=1 Tax=Cyprinodon tularosa TaxID=77115 RepID=UPI0018E1E529|nr:A-kinase anchor protein 12 [Cyprinodon tularosa]